MNAAFWMTPRQRRAHALAEARSVASGDANGRLRRDRLSEVADLMRPTGKLSLAFA